MVPSNSGIAAGMTVVSANVPAGTTVAQVSGNSITLSANATASHGGDAARFSMLTDAQGMAARGGTTTRVMSTQEMPTHNHGVTDPGHTHAPASGNFITTTGSGGVFQSGASGASNNTATATATTGITINNAGGGSAHITGQPTVAINYIVRVLP